MGKKIITVLALMLGILPLWAFDLVVPASGDASYTLLEGNSSFVVDDTVFYKRAFNRAVLAERYSEGVTLLSWGNDRYLIVLLDADAREMDSSLYSLSYATESPYLLAVGSTVDTSLVSELGVSTVFTTSSLDAATRAMLRRNGVSLMEVASGDIIQFEADGVNVISGSKTGGIYVRCPHCGELVYVEL